MAVLISQPKFQRIALLAACSLIVTYFLLERSDRIPYQANWEYVHTSFDWANRVPKYPIPESLMTRLPEGTPRDLAPVQHVFTEGELSETHNKTQADRRDAVRQAAIKTWNAYGEYAWGRDQLSPQSLRGADGFNGWGATLVDSLDTLWIMGLRKEFKQAVRMVAKIDWAKTNSRDCSLFESTIRYLGGLLSAYDLSGEKVLLNKAAELGEMLYAAFDTPNHLPANNLNFIAVKEGLLYASKRESTAAVGTLSMEFTRLSQLTGDPKYFHVIDNIKKHFERTQDTTKLPGMWPMFIDLRNDFITEDNAFSLGAMSDSAYEYLSKMYSLLGGLDETYKRLHMKAALTIKQHLLFRPMLPDSYPASPPDILFSGTVLSNGKIIELLPDVSHLGCFAGGMFALGGKLFHDEEHVKIGERLARGCAWAYDVFPTGIMPEISAVVPCKQTPELTQCDWNETLWREKNSAAPESGGRPLPKPFTVMRDRQYLLRPEAIESVFVLYRITGKTDFLDLAWRMWQAVKAATETKWAFSAIMDVNADGSTTKIDAMESYWMAETLKYYYLIFSDPELISLDDFVFNTEAHPFRLLKASGGGK
ncbi:glycoside hydrolase family 47 protein [Immersiella caudata]|uniref:alpha-1,2-Mannosidase n=1 Tax=Immersiella caudata TaxID=314043 RepID=A0AA39XFG7_9PEZI|nr:glycoside hydrolase family 47 protein [Immersiella caudata]